MVFYGVGSVHWIILVTFTSSTEPTSMDTIELFLFCLNIATVVLSVSLLAWLLGYVAVIYITTTEVRGFIGFIAVVAVLAVFLIALLKNLGMF